MLGRRDTTETKRLVLLSIKRYISLYDTIRLNRLTNNLLMNNQCYHSILYIVL